LIFVTSDFHFNHNKEFVYKKRGFETVEDMNEAIINAVNSVVMYHDDLYILGDLMLGDNDKGLECLKRIKCNNLHIVYGNHDTDTRKALYQTLPQNIVEAGHALVLKYNKFHYYFSHYPTLTSNVSKESLYQMTLNIHGHTHQDEVFLDKDKYPFMFHAGVDSAVDLKPWSLDEIGVLLTMNYHIYYGKKEENE